MYSLFYNLNDRPFRLTPELKYFYNSRPHKRAIVHMRFGFDQPDGILLLTGEKGIGKTTLVHLLIEEMDKQKNIVALIQKPSRNDSDFLPAILASLQIPITEYQPRVMFNTLRKFLIEQTRKQKKVLLIIDEAQELSQNCLEFIRLLSAIRMDEDGIIQTVLVGTNELESVISEHANQAFRQHIVMSYNMHPLQVSDTREYINHRLQVAGWRDDPQIDDETYAAIHQMTGGIPYEINRYSDRLLLLGMLQEKHHLTKSEAGQLSSVTLEKLDRFEAGKQHAELANASMAIDKEIVTEGVFEEEDTPAPEAQAIEQMFEQLDISDDETEKEGKSPFFDKETVITLVAAYLLSFLPVVLIDKYLDDTSVKAVPVEISVAKTSDNESKLRPSKNSAAESPPVDNFQLPVIPEIHSPDKNKPVSQFNDVNNNVAQEVVVETKSRDSIVDKIPNLAIDTASLDNTNASQFTDPTDLGLGEPPDPPAPAEVADSAPEQLIDDALLDGFFATQEPQDIEPPDNTEPASPDVIKSIVDRPLIEDDLPITTAKAELADKSFRAKSDSERLDRIKLNNLVSRFEVAYQFGDMDQIDKLFSFTIVSNNVDSKAVLMNEYEKLFTITDFRRMRIYDVNWRIDDQVAVGEGGFEASIREKGSRNKQKYKGSIILHIKNQEKGLEITELYYNYENL